jgi:GntR family transcriptional regulator / MocR family aminotransferase
MDFVIQIQLSTDLPLHRQVYEQIRAAILTGRLRSRQRLPASRQLAKSLGVSRTTIVQSYEQLISEGYLQTQAGAGTFVCSQIPDHLLNAVSPQTQASVNTEFSAVEMSDSSGLSQSSGLSGSSELKSEFKLSVYGDRVLASPARHYPLDCEFSFRYGLPALDLFPMHKWRRLQRRHALKGTDWLGYAPEPMGYEPLREQIAHYIAQTRAVRCQPEQILITYGTQQSLSLLVRSLVNSGEAVAMENPGYLSAYQVFCGNGAKVVPVSLDAEGIQVEGPEGLWAYSKEADPSSLGASNWPPKLVYVTPSHQFPTGVLMSLSRRLALLQWAQQTNALIVEDDYDSEFRYGGRPVPSLQGLDTHGRVIYVGTFSKIMFPGLRLGYMVLPEALVPVLRQAKWLSDRQCSWLDQQVLSDFIQEGSLATHVRRMRGIYEGRRRQLIESLQALSDQSNIQPDIQPDTQPNTQPKPNLEILGDASGLHIMARLPTLRCDRELIALAKTQGVSLFSAQLQYLPSNRAPVEGEFIFGFGNLTEAAIKAAIARLNL